MFNLDSALDVSFTNTAGDLTIDGRVAMASFSDNRTVEATEATINIINIKFTKPFNALFIYMPTPSVNVETIADMFFTKPNGSRIPLTDYVDGTQGLTQSGYIYWQPEKDVSDGSQAGQEYTLSIIYHTGFDIVFGGINILFCDKFDLLREYPDLDNLLGITDERVITPQLIRIMESTMLEIEKKVTNSSFRKEDRQYFSTEKELDRWDLLQINQINQAATYWVLGKLFYFLSDSPEDVYMVKSQKYQALGESAFESVNLSIDLNDNGSLDVFEGEREYDNVEITLER